MKVAQHPILFLGPLGGPLGEGTTADALWKIWDAPIVRGGVLMGLRKQASCALSTMQLASLDALGLGARVWLMVEVQSDEPYKADCIQLARHPGTSTRVMLALLPRADGEPVSVPAASAMRR